MDAIRQKSLEMRIDAQEVRRYTEEALATVEARAIPRDVNQRVRRELETAKKLERWRYTTALSGFDIFLSDSQGWKLQDIDGTVIRLQVDDLDEAHTVDQAICVLVEFVVSRAVSTLNLPYANNEGFLRRVENRLIDALWGKH